MTWIAVLAVVMQTLPTSIWPTTVAGYLALVLSLVTAAGLVFNAGKQKNQIDGYGRRLSDVEGDLKELSGALSTFQQVGANLLAAQSQLLDRLARAEAGTEKCQDDARDVAINLGSKVDDLRRTMERQQEALRMELHGLTIELQTRGHISPRGPGAFTHQRKADDDKL